MQTAGAPNPHPSSAAHCPPDPPGPTIFGTRWPVHPRPPLAHPLHWPFRAWADVLLRRPVELLAIATVVLLVGGSTLLFWTERGAGGTIHSWWDALWLCVTSASTDSYGDVAPVTAWGRVVSISIAFLGIVLVGSFTAAITSYIVRDPPPDAELLCDVNQRLERVEALLLELKARQ